MLLLTGMGTLIILKPIEEATFIARKEILQSAFYVHLHAQDQKFPKRLLLLPAWSLRIRLGL